MTKISKKENKLIEENKELRKAIYDIMYITDPLGHFGHEKAHKIACDILNKANTESNNVCAKCGGSGVIGNGPTSFNPKTCDCITGSNRFVAMDNSTREKTLEERAMEYADFAKATDAEERHLREMLRQGFIAGATQSQQKWIDAKERLPDSKRDVLGVVKLMNGKHAVMICNYTRGNEIEIYDSSGEDEGFLEAGWYECEEQSDGDFDEQYFERKVTHWCELPSTADLITSKNKSDGTE